MPTLRERFLQAHACGTADSFVNQINGAILRDFHRTWLNISREAPHDIDIDQAELYLDCLHHELLTMDDDELREELGLSNAQLQRVAKVRRTGLELSDGAFFTYRKMSM